MIAPVARLSIPVAHKTSRVFLNTAAVCESRAIGSLSIVNRVLTAALNKRAVPADDADYDDCPSPPATPPSEPTPSGANFRSERNKHA